MSITKASSVCDESFSTERRTSARARLGLEHPPARPLDRSGGQAAEQTELTRALLALTDLANQLNACETLDEVLERVLAAAAGLTQSCRAAIILPNAGQSALRVAMTLGNKGGVTKGDRVPLDGTVGSVFAERRTRLLDPSEDPDSGGESELWPAHFGCACIPLSATGGDPDDPCVGVLVCCAWANIATTRRMTRSTSNTSACCATSQPGRFAAC